MQGVQAIPNQNTQNTQTGSQFNEQSTQTGPQFNEQSVQARPNQNTQDTQTNNNVRNQIDRQDSQDISDISSIIGSPRHRLPKISQSTQNTQTGPQFNEQNTQTGPQFNEQDTQINIDEDTQYPNIDEDIQPGYPWRPRRCPNIDHGTQTDPPAPYPRRRKTSSFDAGKYIPPPPTPTPTLPPRKNIPLLPPTPPTREVDKKDASIQLSYNNFMLKLHQLMTRNARNLRLRNLLNKMGVDWETLHRKTSNYPDFYDEFHKMANETYNDPRFNLGKVESPSPNIKGMQKYDIVRDLLERMIKTYKDEEERMAKYQSIPYHVDDKLDANELKELLSSYSDDANPKDAYDPNKFKTWCFKFVRIIKETPLLDPYKLYYGPKKSNQSFSSRIPRLIDPVNLLDF